MASAKAGVVTAAEVNGMPKVNNSQTGTPAFWTNVWFGIAVLFILFVHVRFGGE